VTWQKRKNCVQILWKRYHKAFKTLEHQVVKHLFLWSTGTCKSGSWRRGRCNFTGCEGLLARQPGVPLVTDNRFQLLNTTSLHMLGVLHRRAFLARAPYPDSRQESIIFQPQRFVPTRNTTDNKIRVRKRPHVTFISLLLPFFIFFMSATNLSKGRSRLDTQVFSLKNKK
jgi:hypothetical protein